MSVWGRTSANSTPVAVEGGAAGLRQVGGKGLVRCTRLREQRRDAVVVPARCLPQAALQVIEPPPSAVGIRVTAHPRLGRTLMRRDLRRGPPCRLCQLRPARSVSKCRVRTPAPCRAGVVRRSPPPRSSRRRTPPVRTARGSGATCGRESRVTTLAAPTGWGCPVANDRPCQVPAGRGDNRRSWRGPPDRERDSPAAPERQASAPKSPSSMNRVFGKILPAG